MLTWPLLQQGWDPTQLRNWSSYQALIEYKGGAHPTRSQKNQKTERAKVHHVKFLKTPRNYP